MPQHSDKFGAIAATITVAIMFLIIVFARDLIKSVGTGYKLGAFVISIAGTFGIYRLISNTLFRSFKKNLRFRKWVLGPAFLEGTWVGCFPHSGSYHFTVEHFDQENGETKIIGKEFDIHGKTYGTWSSYASSISLPDRRLVYAYSCDIFSRDVTQNGLGVFTLQGKGKKAAPNRLDGYSVDLVIDQDNPDDEPRIKKDPNKEIKISDEMIPDSQAIEKAKELFATMLNSPAQ